MRIQVSGKQIDIGEALRLHVEDRMGEAVAKYFDRPVEAVVTFSKEGHVFVTDSSVHLATGMKAQATARADEIYAAFEGAIERHGQAAPPLQAPAQGPPPRPAGVRSKRSAPRPTSWPAEGMTRRATSPRASSR